MRSRIVSRLPRVAWAAAAGRPLARLDLTVLRFLRTRAHQAPVERAMLALGWAGEWGAIWSGSTAVAAVADPPRRGRWLVASGVPFAAIVVNYAFKRVARRERPLLQELPALGYAAGSLSFPSGHAVSSVAAATAIARVSPASGPLVYALATLICIGRPYLGMHYPSDVLVGVALGRFLGKAVPGLEPPAEAMRPPPAAA